MHSSHLITLASMMGSAWAAVAVVSPSEVSPASHVHPIIDDASSTYIVDVHSSSSDFEPRANWSVELAKCIACMYGCKATFFDRGTTVSAPVQIGLCMERCVKAGCGMTIHQNIKTEYYNTLGDQSFPTDMEAVEAMNIMGLGSQPNLADPPGALNLG